jgi:hypothetical protein
MAYHSHKSLRCSKTLASAIGLGLGFNADSKIPSHPTQTLRPILNANSYPSGSLRVANVWNTFESVGGPRTNTFSFFLAQ